MENKAVCHYCGTIYDAEQGKCPLCGSSAQEKSQRAPAQRKRSTEQERRPRTVRETPRTPAREKAPKPEQNRNTKGLLTTALVFLALSVLVVLYFIGDMIGWWPGLENLVDREGLTSTVNVETSCTVLRVEPENLLLSQVGQTQEMTVFVNDTCEEKLYCSSSDEAVVTIAETAQTAIGTDEKSATFTLTAAGEGTATVIVKCGSREAKCTVTCGTPTDDSLAPTLPADYEPLLNAGRQLTLTRKGQGILLEVDNLPEGITAAWSSSDEAVAEIDERGILVAVAPGTATITANVGGKTVSLQVDCEFDAEDDGAHLQYEDVTISIGETLGLYLYDAAGNRLDGAEYKVKNPNICDMEGSAVVGISRGTTNVTVTYQGREFTCIVRVVN